MLELVGLSHVSRQRAGKFSLGMGQRLGIAAALLGDPGVLLFEEPVNGLDPDGIRWVRGLMKGLAGEGRTVFVSSHLLSEMALTTDQVVAIGKDRLIAQLPTADLIARSSQNDGSLSDRNLDEARIGDIAAAIPVVLHELSPQSASLEEAFMEITEGSVREPGKPGRWHDSRRAGTMNVTTQPGDRRQSLPPGHYRF
jgi:ABC-2 type transport system ATP-binding protein